MKKEFAVIGLGRFGESIALKLSEKHSVLAIDQDLEKIEIISDTVDDAICIDATKLKNLKQVGINNFDTVIVALGEDSLQQSLIICIKLKEIGIKNIIAKASSDEQKIILESLGVNTVIQPEKHMGNWIANKLINDKIENFLSLSNGYRIDEIVVKKNICDNILNCKLKEIKAIEKLGIRILLMYRNEEIIIPNGEEVLLEGDTLVIVGKDDAIEKFEKKI